MREGRWGAGMERSEMKSPWPPISLPHILTIFVWFAALKPTKIDKLNDLSYEIA